MAMEKTDDEMRFQRGVALKAIATEAEKMRDKGALPFEIRTFITGARSELTKQAPDPETYSKALNAAYAHKASKGEI